MKIRQPPICCIEVPFETCCPLSRVSLIRWSRISYARRESCSQFTIATCLRQK